MTGIESFYFGLLVAFLGALGGYGYIQYRTSRLKKNQYALYKLRDDLIYLVAGGYLEEDSRIFRHFYGWMNSWIDSVQDLDFMLLFKVLRDTRKDVEQRKQVEQLKQAVSHSDPRVQNTVDQVFTTVLAIMVDNSFTLRFLVRHPLWEKSWRDLAERLYQSSIVPKSTRLKWDDYNHYKKLHTQFAYSG